MSRSVNKVTLIGNVGKQPEIRHLADGEAVASFSLATNKEWKDHDGRPVKRTEWHSISCFKGLATIVEKFLHSGDKVYIEGEIRYSESTDKNGIKRKFTNIVCSNLILLGAHGEAAYSEDEPVKKSGKKHVDEVPFDDDIPF